MEKWYALLQCGIVYEVLHCTENQIKLKADGKIAQVFSRKFVQNPYLTEYKICDIL